ncbi:MAG: hypothetical protein SFZ23_00600 [Planctomycetota bacterium]|nr:hypothetical protein [Planctomycetota bacterium]
MISISCFTRVAATLAFASGAAAQWNPPAGQWGKSDPRDLRVMTFNIRDAANSAAVKTEGFNAWTGLARVIAAMKPDVVLMQECGELPGGGVNSQSDLTTVFNLLINGGNDPFNGNAPVTSWVRKYDANYTLPHIYVSDQSDNFNRNVVLSRFPFTDLTGDGRNVVSFFIVQQDLYVPSGGNSGIRGFIFAEIDLPGDRYGGDLVIGNGHLKAGGTTSDLADRLIAAQRNAYFVDYMFNGGGTSTPDPRNRIFDTPAATRVLDARTPVIWGGDLNEDEENNGRDGPVLWMSRAAGTGDGTDRDRSDSLFDDARDLFNNSRVTQGSSSKLDRLIWQDSIATLRRSWILNSTTIPLAGQPPEFFGFNGSTSNPNGTPQFVTQAVSDHRAVLADFILPEPVPQPPGNFVLLTPANGTGNVALTPTLTWSVSSNATSYVVRIATNPQLTSPIFTSAPVATTSFVVPGGVLSECATYYWGVTATSTGGNVGSTPIALSFSTIIPADYNRDGTVDFFDYLDFAEDSGAEDPAADFNADGSVDFFDYLDFAERYSNEC